MTTQLDTLARPLRAYLEGGETPSADALHLFQKAYIRETKVQRGIAAGGGASADLSAYSHLLDDVIDRMKG